VTAADFIQLHILHIPRFDELELSKLVVETMTDDKFRWICAEIFLFVVT
jgi:hypothetical protein